MKHEPHVPKRILDDLAVAENRRIKIHEDEARAIEKAAGIQEVKRSRQCFYAKTILRRHVPEKLDWRNGLAVAKWPQEALIRFNNGFTAVQCIDRLEGSVQHISPPSRCRDPGFPSIYMCV